MYKTYDYIICGGGFSGLTQAFYLSKYKTNSKILLIEEKHFALSNKTFSFWKDDKLEFDFESIITKKWKKLEFKSNGVNKVLYLSKYTYCTILGKDYEKYIKDELSKNPNVQVINEKILDIEQKEDKEIVRTEKDEYQGKYLFNSIYKEPEVKKKDIFLKGNFGGYVVKTNDDVFDDTMATLFDFTDKGWNFFYVLPYDKRTVLIENISTQHTQESELKEYINRKLGDRKYEITYAEGGNVPMTNHLFQTRTGKKIFNIGIHRGMVKPTTCLAFNRVWRNCEFLAKSVNNFRYTKSKFVFRLSDSIVLYILNKHEEEFQKIYEHLFLNVKTDLLFKFLDERTSLFDHLVIAYKIRKVLKYFVKAFLEYMFL